MDRFDLMREMDRHVYDLRRAIYGETSGESYAMNDELANVISLMFSEKIQEARTKNGKYYAVSVSDHSLLCVNYIKSIKLIRTSTHLGLTESKDIIVKLRENPDLPVLIYVHWTTPIKAADFAEFGLELIENPVLQVRSSRSDISELLTRYAANELTPTY